jgi:hypothetical protein
MRPDPSPGSLPEPALSEAEGVGMTRWTSSRSLPEPALSEAEGVGMTQTLPPTANRQPHM